MDSCPSVQKIKPSSIGEIFFGGTEKLIVINRHNDCALLTALTAPAGGERSEPTAGARGVGELKRIPYPKKLDEEEKF